MIVDTIQNASKYFSVHPLFSKAFDFIYSTDLANEPDGKSDIAEGLKAIFSNKPGVTADASVAKFECHNKHIDIQLCINGIETIGWKPRKNVTKKTAAITKKRMYSYITNSLTPIFN